MTTKMKMVTGLLMLTLSGLTGAAQAAEPAAEARADIQKTLGFAPQFLTKLPDLALPGVWDEMKGLQLNPNTALPGSIKELIGLAVAAQVPCRYCIIAHTEFARSTAPAPTRLARRWRWRRSPATGART